MKQEDGKFSVHLSPQSKSLSQKSWTLPAKPFNTLHPLEVTMKDTAVKYLPVGNTEPTSFSIRNIP